MFEKLGDFKVQRTNKQAVGFYIVYLIGFVLAGMLVGGLTGALFGSEAVEQAFRLGGILSVALTLGLGAMVLNKKKLNSEMNMWLVVLAAGVLALLGGGLLGLIPVAYLTTKKPKK